MRRAPFALLLLVTSSASAAPWGITLEGGGEADSNVRRVEAVPGNDKPVSAGVARAGARLARKDKLFGGAYAIDVSSLVRVVGDSSVKDENVALFTADLRWMHPIGDRPASVGFDFVGADALPISSSVGARTFRNLGGDALLGLRSGEDRQLVLGVGYRNFAYTGLVESNGQEVTTHDFDWSGAVASARLDLVLWQTANKTKTLELATTVGFEAREYGGVALTRSVSMFDPTHNIPDCPPTGPPHQECLAPTSIGRRDRYSRAQVELDWVGRIVASLGYQLVVIDSNSFGQSLIRNRIVASGTIELPWKMFGSASVALQLDKYTDGVVVVQELQTRDLTSLEDENRSSVQIRLARPITAAWSAEVRAAIWRDLTSTMNSSFRRELIYAGMIYSR